MAKSASHSRRNPDPVLLGLAFLSKILLYGVALTAIGTGLHRSMGIISVGKIFRAISFALLVVLVLRLFVLNAQMAGGLRAGLSFTEFSWVWAARGHQTIAFAIGALALLAASVVNNVGAPALAAIVIAASFGLAGHTQGLEAPGIAPWLVGLHLLIAGFWFAAPATLWPRSDRTNEEVLQRMQRFSAIATITVPILFASGLWLLWRLAGGFTAVATTPYGQVLLVKLALAMTALALGAWNKFFVTRRFSMDAGAGRRALKSTLRLDAAIFFGVLATIAAATTFTGPHG